MSGFVIGADGPEVRIPGRVAWRLSRTLQAAVGAAQRRGERVDPDVLEVIDTVVVVGRRWAQSMHTADVPLGTSECSDKLCSFTMTSMEAARLLGCSDRNVRALAHRHGWPSVWADGRRRLLFDSAVVVEFARGRNTHEGA